MRELVNRQARRAARKLLEQRSEKFTECFIRIPLSQWPPSPPKGLVKLWQNNRFLVQEYAPVDGAIRLSIILTKLDENGRWADGITWDDLQHIKKSVGYRNRMAVEIYPAEKDLVNVSNMRHLWIPNEDLSFGWKAS